MAEHIRLGAFHLETPISSGGMGTVWRGRHVVTDTPVAVKVIAAAYARDPVYLDGFEREVRAVARMEHPRIISVYDFGFVDSAAERQSGGELPRRSPWLAMEFATRGSLARLPGIGDWATLKVILFDILDALAHSHARHVIHRDLKPGNVLLTDSGDGVHCKLTDFGISHANSRALSTREVFASSAGTPWYMAPEQVDSRWRDYGPWTDLYAFGCLAYQLASGDTPFTGQSAVRVARQQLFDRPPPLQPRLEVPPGFQAWLDRLLNKEVPHRFRRAADAAWALHQISPRESGPIRVSLRSGADPSCVDAMQTTKPGDSTPGVHNYDSEVATLTFLDQAESPAPQMPTFSVPGSLLTFSVPPFPATWKVREQFEARLPGAGLGLYRLREVPFVGREAERDSVWETLRDVVTNRHPRAIAIRGAPGTGKSRLALWIARRAHELGIVSHMHASHSPVRGPGHGVGPMMEAYLGCGGLDLERSYLRVRRLIATQTAESPDAVGYYSAAGARIMHPVGDAPGVPMVRFTSAEERYRVVQRLAETVADRRPLIVTFDDVQWGYDAIALTQRLLQSDRPILVILTIREDQLAERPLESDALRELESGDVTSLRIGPLSRDEHLELIDRLLVLEPTLREQVLERTVGSPLFASELLGDWVRRGVLKSGPNGFRLDSYEELPADLYDLWNTRIDRLLYELEDPESARSAIEVGAAIGTTVSEHEWREACAQLGIDIDDALIDLLAEHAIVEPGDNGWNFRHQLLRDSIANAAREAGRATAHHHTVAAILQFDETADNQLRRALHFLAVDDYESAGEPLLQTIEEMAMAGRTRELAAVAAMLEGVAGRLEPDHPIHQRACEVEMKVARLRGDNENIQRVIERIRPVAEKHGWQSTLAHLYRLESTLLHEKGEVERGRAVLDRALQAAHRARAPGPLGDIHATLGWNCVRFGELQQASAHYQAARDHLEMASDHAGALRAILGLAEVERLSDNLAEARRLSDDAGALCRRHGYRLLLCSQLNQRGEISRSAGEYENARRYYAEAQELARLTGNDGRRPTYQLNLGLAVLYLNRPQEAAEHMAKARDEFLARGATLWAYHAELGLLWCAAATGDTDKWDSLYQNLLAGATADVVERESVEHAIASGDHWISLGDPERALAAYRLARRLVPDGFVETFEPRLDSRIQSAIDHAQSGVAST